MVGIEYTKLRIEGRLKEIEKVIAEIRVILKDLQEIKLQLHINEVE